MEIIANLHWIKGFISNVYLWVDEDGLTLVDTGRPGDARRITSYISEIGFEPSDITSILITHADYDHAGAIATLHEQSGATVFTGYRSADLLIEGKSPDHLPRLVQWTINTLFRYRPLPTGAIQIVNDGEIINDQSPWQVIATPGHSPDHQSFFSPVHSVLFAGDALSTRGGRLKCSPNINTGDMPAARLSARNLLRLTPAVIACGHGPPKHDHDSGELISLSHDLEK
jgi:glyoxylase-like metal-dependent hydrolase (beta-lactamase superfamily II)